MSLHQILHDVESDTGSRLVVVSLIEGGKNLLLFVRTDSHAIILCRDDEMLAVFGKSAREMHVITGVLGGVGHQITDYLGNRLAIDDCRKIVGRIIHLQSGSLLLQGWLEPFCHRMHQLGNILQSEVNLQSLLLHLVEIEQLVDKRQESLGISVYHVQGLVHRLTILHTLADLLPLLLQVLQRSDDQRNRSTDFVGNHGEELQSCIAHLLLLLHLQLVEFLLMAALLSLHPRLGVEPDEPADNQQIQNLGR